MSVFGKYAVNLLANEVIALTFTSSGLANPDFRNLHIVDFSGREKGRNIYITKKEKNQDIFEKEGRGGEAAPFNFI